EQALDRRSDAIHPARQSRQRDDDVAAARIAEIPAIEIVEVQTSKSQLVEGIEERILAGVVLVHEQAGRKRDRQRENEQNRYRHHNTRYIMSRLPNYRTAGQHG